MAFTGRLGSNESQPGNLVPAFGALLAVIAPLDATPGSYAVTGSPATLRVARRLVATPGAYAVTGTPATLRRARRLSATAGTYALTGIPATLRVTRRLTATKGSYLLTGAPATLTRTVPEIILALYAQPGSYVLTGAPATLTATLNRSRRRRGAVWLVDIPALIDESPVTNGDMETWTVPPSESCPRDGCGSAPSPPSHAIPPRVNSFPGRPRPR